jgi:hypothetical protein
MSAAFELSSTAWGDDDPRSCRAGLRADPESCWVRRIGCDSLSGTRIDAEECSMWKPEQRSAADRRGLRYPSDLTDAEGRWSNR